MQVQALESGSRRVATWHGTFGLVVYTAGVLAVCLGAAPCSTQTLCKGALSLLVGARRKRSQEADGCDERLLGGAGSSSCLDFQSSVVRPSLDPVRVYESNFAWIGTTRSLFPPPHARPCAGATTSLQHPFSTVVIAAALAVWVVVAATRLLLPFPRSDAGVVAEESDQNTLI